MRPSIIYPLRPINPKEDEKNLRSPHTHYPLEIYRFRPGFEKPLSVAHHLVRTRICPEPVRLAVVRSRPKKSKPYRYFLVYTTDLSLSVESLVRYYTLRCGFETHMKDSKQELGFDHYQVRGVRSINRSVLLSFVAASLAQLLAWPAFEKDHARFFPL